MLLSELIKGIPDIKNHIAEDVEISDLSLDSRTCREGSLFVALGGVRADGNAFIDNAIKNGARAVLTSNKKLVSGGIQKLEGNGNSKPVFIQHDNPRLVLGALAARFYGRQPSCIVAITGTNGKTSVAHFCRQIWRQLGKKSASIGTLGTITEDADYTGGESLTTPDVISLHKTLSDLSSKGIDNVALEASSHGLDQQRLAGIKISVAAITNISRDHLDYHGTLENYTLAKMKLFTDVLIKGGTAVINADINEYEKIAEICNKSGHKVLGYGKNGNYIKLLDVVINAKNQHVKIEIEGKKYNIITQLVGSFQVDNLLCALGMIIASGDAVEDAVAACCQVTAVAGRMEKIAEHPCGSPIVVDYAHTPDALQKALLTLRPYVSGKLVVVFGCGGDRDKGKRPIMGQVAVKYADLVIVTDDNPRTENPSAIRKDILITSPKIKEISDRKVAISYAVKSLQEGDVLLLAGKGHEKYQIIGNEKTPFDEVEIVQSLLQNDFYG